MPSKKYIKKPVIVDALQWTGENFAEMHNFLKSVQRIKGCLIIKTLEGERLASINDFIIKDVTGEFYPCKPVVFESTYAEVIE